MANNTRWHSGTFSLPKNNWSSSGSQKVSLSELLQGSRWPLFVLVSAGPTSTMESGWPCGIPQQVVHRCMDWPCVSPLPSTPPACSGFKWNQPHFVYILNFMSMCLPLFIELLLGELVEEPHWWHGTGSGCQGGDGGEKGRERQKKEREEIEMLISDF